MASKRSQLTSKRKPVSLTLLILAVLAVVGMKIHSPTSDSSNKGVGNNILVAIGGSGSQVVNGQPVISQTAPLTPLNPVADLLAGNEAVFSDVCQRVAVDPVALQQLCDGARVGNRSRKLLALKVLEQAQDTLSLQACKSYLRDSVDSFEDDPSVQQRLYELQLRRWSAQAKNTWSCRGQVVIRTRDPKHPGPLANALVKILRDSGVRARVSSERASKREATTIHGAGDAACADAAVQLRSGLESIEIGGSGLLLQEPRTVRSSTPQVDVLLGSGL